MAHKLRELLMTVFIFVIAIAVAVLAAKMYTQSAMQEQSIQTNKIIVACEPVNFGTGELTVDIQIPEVTGFADTAFEQTLNEQIFDQIKVAARDAQVQARLFWQEMQQAGYMPWMFIFVAGYDVKSDSGIMSLKVTTLLDNGGTGMPNTVIYNADIAECKLLRLSDLFKVDADYQQIINAQIEAAMQDDPARYFDPHNFPGISEDTAFYIADGKLFVTFAKYELMSGMSGEPSFEIPTEHIRDLVKQKYINLFE